MGSVLNDACGSQSGRKPATVLLVDHSPVVGGAELSLIEIAETLSPRFMPIVVCTTDCKSFVELAVEKGIQVFSIPMPRLRGAGGPLALLRSLISFSRLVVRLKPAIIHSNTVRSHIVSAFVGRLCGVKVIWTLRDFDFPMWLYRILSPLVHRVVCVSEAVQNLYGLANGKTRVILNGVTRPSLDRKQERARIRKEFGIPENAHLAVCVGRLIEWKGQEEFLRAAAVTKKLVSDAYFMVVGEGPSESYKQTLKSIASAGGLDGQVIFTGFRKDALACICAADLLVHASNEAEAFGRVLIEAMAVGTPLIAAPRGGPSEIVENGISGLLVDPADSEHLGRVMASVLTNRELSARLSEGGLSRFERFFDQAIETRAVEAVYDELLALDGSKPA